MVDGIRTLKDHSIKLSLVTQELPASDMATIFGLSNQLATCVLASEGSTITDKDMEVSLEFPQEKSPAKRLRAVLYVLWKQAGSDQDFELFYRRYLDRLIDSLKEKLT